MVKVRVAPSMVPLALLVVAFTRLARTSSSAKPSDAIFCGSIWTLTAGFCWPATLTWATPEIWLICWATIFSA